jgi:hypothetical protein
MKNKKEKGENMRKRFQKNVEKKNVEIKNVEIKNVEIKKC